MSGTKPDAPRKRSFKGRTSWPVIIFYTAVLYVSPVALPVSAAVVYLHGFVPEPGPDDFYNTRWCITVMARVGPVITHLEQRIATDGLPSALDEEVVDGLVCDHQGVSFEIPEPLASQLRREDTEFRLKTPRRVAVLYRTLGQGAFQLCARFNSGFGNYSALVYRSDRTYPARWFEHGAREFAHWVVVPGARDLRDLP